MRSRLLFLCLAAALRLGAEPSPVNPRAFIVVPGEPLALKFKGLAGPAAPVAEIRDLAGRAFGEFPLTPSPGSEFRLTGDGLSVGYYTVTVEGKSFGLLCQSPFPGEPDRFFGLDGFLSWNKISHSERYEALKLLRRYGVAAARDRFQWDVIQKDPRVYHFRNEYDENRRLYPRTGVELLDVHHGSPAWIRPELPRFPEDLQKAAVFWTTLAANWRQYWSAVEIWNEPEGGFGANLPPDQLLPGAKAMRIGVLAAAPEVRLGGAAFTSLSPAGTYHRAAVRNRMLENVDFVSFHTYGTAADLVGLVREYRDWLKRNGREGMPLWMTEISRVAWDNFRTPEEAKRVAAEIALQAAAGRAVGLERIYFFALFDLKEGNKTFGFLDADRTPRASFAALLQSVRRLSHARYLGRLRTVDRQIASARVYAVGEGRLIVVEAAETGGVFRPGFPLRGVEGLDGRRLEPGHDGSVPLADPVLYLDAAAVPAALLDTASPENELLARAAVPPPEREKPFPVVLFPHPDFSAISGYSSVGGYRAEAGAPVPVALDLWNLGGRPETLRLTVETALRLAEGEKTETLTVPPYGKLRKEFKVAIPEGAEEELFDLDFKLESSDAAVLEQASLTFRAAGAAGELRVPPGGTGKITFGGLENYTIRIKDQPWNDRSDLEASFRLRYTKESLILSVEVEDDRHYADFPPAEMWKGDSLQVGLRLGNPKTIAERARFFEYTVALTPKGPLAWRGGLRAIPLSIVRKGTHTVYELSLPAAELGAAAFRPGDVIRLSLVVNDNDGAGRKGFLQWGGGLGVNKNPEEFNRVILQ